jgi:hypothetical protein
MLPRRNLIGLMAVCLAAFVIFAPLAAYGSADGAAIGLSGATWAAFMFVALTLTVTAPPEPPDSAEIRQIGAQRAWACVLGFVGFSAGFAALGVGAIYFGSDSARPLLLSAVGAPVGLWLAVGIARTLLRPLPGMRADAAGLQIGDQPSIPWADITALEQLAYAHSFMGVLQVSRRSGGVVRVKVPPAHHKPSYAALLDLAERHTRVVRLSEPVRLAQAVQQP